MRPWRPARLSASSWLTRSTVVEAPARSGTDAASSDGDGQMCLARPGPADQDDIALLSDEATAGDVAHQGLVDQRVLEGEVVDVLLCTRPSELFTVQGLLELRFPELVSLR